MAACLLFAIRHLTRAIKCQGIQWLKIAGCQPPPADEYHSGPRLQPLDVGTMPQRI